MYLTRLTLDLRSQVIQNWLKNPYNIHRRLWMSVPEEGKQKHSPGKIQHPPFLYKVEASHGRILVQAPQSFDWRLAFGEEKFNSVKFDTKILAAEKFITLGRMFRFSLLANPTQKKIFADNPAAVKAKAHQQGWRRSKKIGVYSEAEQLEWLARKGVAGGFKLKSAVIESTETISAMKKKTEEGGSGEIKKIFTVAFAGLLEITDPEKFSHTYAHGIGSAKAFGCGLLLLAPAGM